MKKINICELAGTFQAYLNCKKSNNGEWAIIHASTIETMCELLPHGSGIDSGMKFLWDESTGQKLVFTCDFHHMDENGMYDGWTEHKVIITPSFPFGYTMRITGRDRDMIKEYLHDLLHGVFSFEPDYQIKKQAI